MIHRSGPGYSGETFLLRSHILADDQGLRMRELQTVIEKARLPLYDQTTPLRQPRTEPIHIMFLVTEKDQIRRRRSDRMLKCEFGIVDKGLKPVASSGRQRSDSEFSYNTGEGCGTAH